MGRVLACSDLHGQIDLWNMIKKELKPDDTLYVLGDAADRGDYGWEILKDCLIMPNVHYLLGNHDQMLIDDERYLWHYNGGEATMAAVDADPQSDFFIEKLSECPRYVKYKNKKGQIIHLSHAGFSFMENGFIPDQNDLLWDRFHIRDRYLGGNDNEFIVFGHTPCLLDFYTYAYDKEFLPYEVGVRFYGGHKICIDSGCFASGKIGLFNLDTLEVEKVWCISNEF